MGLWNPGLLVNEKSQYKCSQDRSETNYNGSHTLLYPLNINSVLTLKGLVLVVISDQPRMIEETI